MSTSEKSAPGVSRRNVLKTTGSVAAAAAITPGLAEAKGRGGGRKKLSGHPILAENPAVRRAQAVKVRLAAAKDQLRPDLPRQRTNGDDGYRDRRASFFKTLPQNEFGEVDRSAYRKLLRALDSGEPRAFDRIPLDPSADRKLANPQASFKFEIAGRDGQNTFMRPAPKFAGRETAAEMGELYWKALARDVPFINYDIDPLIAAATSDLNAFSKTVGPKDGGVVTAQTIFRGETPGDLTGPYISQLLYRDIPFGNTTITQRYVTPAPGDDYMTTTSEWLAVQRGVAPPPLFKSNPRFISDARALGEYVHIDFSYQAYLSAALILLGMGVADPNNPYNGNPNQGAFVSFGGPDVLDLVAKAGNLSLTGAWYQKWAVHRRLRPETYGGRLQFQMAGQRDYDLPDEIADSEGVARTISKNGNALLPMAFPEGSPTHPSYPAGHATIAGACCTVLKAFFDEDAEMQNNVEANASGSMLLPYYGRLTVGGEINKLANNIALGRDWAGVHYRSDGVDGLDVGEQQAISLLRDYSRTYNERSDGLTLTKFNGKRIRIRNGEVFAERSARS